MSASKSLEVDLAAAFRPNVAPHRVRWSKTILPYRGHGSFTNPKPTDFATQISATVRLVVTKNVSVIVPETFSDRASSLERGSTCRIGLGGSVFVASILAGAMAGVSRRLLGSPAPEKHVASHRRELTTLAAAYLQASTAS
jgi:hypothetical protein